MHMISLSGLKKHSNNRLLCTLSYLTPGMLVGRAILTQENISSGKRDCLKIFA